jgi:hypothetical protein
MSTPGQERASHGQREVHRADSATVRMLQRSAALDRMTEGAQPGMEDRSSAISSRSNAASS